MSAKRTTLLLATLLLLGVVGFLPRAHAASYPVYQNENVPCGTIAPSMDIYVYPDPHTVSSYPFFIQGNVTFPNSVCDALGLQAWQNAYIYMYNDAGQWMSNGGYCSGSYSGKCLQTASGLWTCGNPTPPYQWPSKNCISYTPVLNTYYHIQAYVSYVGTDGAGNLDNPTYEYTLNVYVGAPPDFSIGANPNSLSIYQTFSGSSTITLTSINGYSGTVTVLASSNAVIGGTKFLYWTFGSCGITDCNTSLTIPSGGTPTATINIWSYSNTPTQTYTVTVTGTDSTGLTHSVNISVTVQASSGGGGGGGCSPHPVPAQTSAKKGPDGGPHPC